MPVRRGMVAPRTTLIETIIRKFDTDSKYIVFCGKILGVKEGYVRSVHLGQ